MGNRQDGTQGTQGAPQNAQDVIPSLDNILDGGNEQAQGTVFDDLGSNDAPAETAAEGSAQGAQGDGAADLLNPDPAKPPTDTPAGEPGPPANQDDLVVMLTTDDSLLSADDREFKGLVYEKFQANGIDFKGNLLDANGEIVLSVDDLNAYIETGVLPLDEEGNQVNAKGEVIATASEVVEGTNVVDLTKTFVETELGYSFVNEDGTKKTYPNTAEGNKNFVKDAVLAAQTSAVGSFLEMNPKVKDVFFHLAAGGDLEDFVQSDVDYTSIDVNALSKEQKLEIIKESYVKQGVQNVNSIMNLLDNVGEDKMTQSVSEALLTLQEQTLAEKKINEEKYAQQQEEDKKNLENYWKGVKSVIDKGTLGNIQISNEEKNDFYRYIAEPINSKGDTRESIEAAKETSENQLMISYLRYKGGDVSKLVEVKARLNRAEALRERMGKTIPMPRISNNKERANPERSGAYVPSIDSLLG